jgi:CheY-like chemotaxis protein
MSLFSPKAHSDNQPVRRSAISPDVVPVKDYPSLQGLRVLIVDDEFEARKMVATALEMHGVKVVMSPSAQDALNALRSLTFDVLVSDISMPEQDGYFLMRKVRSHYKRLPALALTACDTAEDHRKVSEAGFQLHIAKPVEAIFLLAAVADLAEMAKRPTDDY